MNYVGDNLIAYRLARAKDGFGRKTGKNFSMPIIEMWRLKEGKVTVVRPFILMRPAA
jgi:ketosteroid isomerase-like protein